MSNIGCAHHSIVRVTKIFMISVPCPNLFMQLNPIQLTVDTATCLWLNKFMQSILGERVSNTDIYMLISQTVEHRILSYLYLLHLYVLVLSR